MFGAQKVVVKARFGFAIASLMLTPLAASAAERGPSPPRCVTITATGSVAVRNATVDRRNALVGIAQTSYGADKRVFGAQNCIIITATGVGPVPNSTEQKFTYLIEYPPITNGLNNGFEFLGEENSNSPLDFDATVLAIAIIETNNWPVTRRNQLVAKKAEICRTNEQHQDRLDRLLDAICARWRVTRPN